MLSKIKDSFLAVFQKHKCAVRPHGLMNGRKFRILLGFVSLATFMQFKGLFTGEYANFITTVCVAALTAFTAQGWKQAEEQKHLPAQGETNEETIQ